MDSMIVAPIVGLAAILFAICLLWSIRNKEKSTPQMIKIHEAIREGAKAFLQRQYKTMSLFIVLITILLGVFFDLLAAISFATGAILSALASYLGMVIAVYFNIRTAQSARRSLKEALTTAYFAGAATGMLLTGLGLFSVGVLYFMSSGQPTKIVGLVFGASLVALFGRVGGGIYAKAADMGADLVGKLEARIPEDDEHNPAVIADLVGDNVGDVAGTGSDVYQSYVSALVSAMIIGLTTIPNAIGLLYPVAVLAIGVLSSIIATFFLKIYANNARLAINRVMYLSAVFAIVGAGSLAWLLFGSLTVFYVVSAGVIMAVLWAFLTEHFTSTDKPPVKMIAKSAQTGPATNVLAGFSIGMESIVFPTIILCIVVFGAFHLVGLYGVVMVTVGFLSVTSTFISMSAYGPIVDNADGILEISRTNSRATNVTAQLDAVGNTNKAICKGYAVGTSVLAQIAMFAVYIDQVNITLLTL